MRILVAMCIVAGAAAAADTSGQDDNDEVCALGGCGWETGT